MSGDPLAPPPAVVPGEPGTITVTATATMPPAAAPRVESVLPDGNYPATAGGPPVGARGWSLVRFYIWKFGGTLLMERSPSGEYVMGRAALPFFACLALAWWKWASNLEVPGGLERMMFALLGVMFGDRGLAIAQQFVTAKHGDPYTEGRR